jgi:ABC-type glycerol-3-phosphate transport system permease component
MATVVALNSSIPPWWTLSAAALFGMSPLILLAVWVERYLSKGSLSGTPVRVGAVRFAGLYKVDYRR